MLNKNSHYKFLNKAGIMLKYQNPIWRFVVSNCVDEVLHSIDKETKAFIITLALDQNPLSFLLPF